MKVYKKMKHIMDDFLKKHQHTYKNRLENVRGEYVDGDITFIIYTNNHELSRMELNDLICFCEENNLFFHIEVNLDENNFRVVIEKVIL